MRTTLLFNLHALSPLVNSTELPYLESCIFAFLARVETDAPLAGEYELTHRSTEPARGACALCVSLLLLPLSIVLYKCVALSLYKCDVWRPAS